MGQVQVPVILGIAVLWDTCGNVADWVVGGVMAVHPHASTARMITIRIVNAIFMIYDSMEEMIKPNLLIPFFFFLGELLYCFIAY